MFRSDCFPHSLHRGWTEIITCPRLPPLPPALPFHHLVIMTLTPSVYLDTQIGVDGIDEDWEGRQGFILSTVSFAEPEIIIHYRYPFCVQNRNSKRQQSYFYLHLIQPQYKDLIKILSNGRKKSVDLIFPVLNTKSIKSLKRWGWMRGTLSVRAR